MDGTPGSSGSVFNGDHDVRSLDNGVGLAADFETEVLGGSRRDRGHDLFAGRAFNRHFGGNRAFVNGDVHILDAVADGNLHFDNFSKNFQHYHKY